MAKENTERRKLKEMPKYKNNASFAPQTQTFFIVKVGIFFHFGHSKPPKQAKTPQILSQNHAKTTGLHELGPMPNHFF